MKLHTLGEFASVVMLLTGCSRTSYFVCRGTARLLNETDVKPTEVQATLKINDERSRFDPEAGEDSAHKGFVEFIPDESLPGFGDITLINDSTVLFFDKTGPRLRFGGEFDRLTRNLAVRADNKAWEMTCRRTNPVRV